MSDRRPTASRSTLPDTARIEQEIAVLESRLRLIRAVRREQEREERALELVEAALLTELREREGTR